MHALACVQACWLFAAGGGVQRALARRMRLLAPMLRSDCVLHQRRCTVHLLSAGCLAIELLKCGDGLCMRATACLMAGRLTDALALARASVRALCVTRGLYSPFPAPLCCTISSQGPALAPCTQPRTPTCIRLQHHAAARASRRAPVGRVSSAASVNVFAAASSRHARACVRSNWRTASACEASEAS